MASRSSTTPNNNLPDLSQGIPEIWRTVIRVSDVNGRDKGTGRFLSPEDQLRQGKEFAERNGGLHDDVASLQNKDLNQSGFSKTYDQRPGIMRHLEDARQGKFQHIIFVYTDRASRSIVDGNLQEREFRAAGIEIHYLDNPGSPDTDEHFETRRDFNLLFAAESSRRQSRRTKQIIKTRTAKSLPHGQAPAWIGQNPQTKEYFLNEEAAAPFRRMVQLRLAGHSGHSISKILNAEGFPTAKGASWSNGRIQRYLSPEYIQKMQGIALVTPGGRTRNGKATDQTVSIPGAFPALIDADTAAAMLQVAATLREGRTIVKRGARGVAAETDYLVAGRIRCGHCGAALTPGNRKQGNQGDLRRCYACIAGVTVPDHPGVSIDAEGIEDAVARVLRLTLIEPVAVPEKKIVKPSARKKKEEDPEALQKTLDRLVQMRANEMIDDETFLRNSQPIKDKLAALTVQEEQSTIPADYAASMKLFQAMTDDTTSTLQWRRLVLSAVKSVRVPVDLPALAINIVPGDAKAIEKAHKNVITPYRTSGELRRVIEVTLKWPVAKWGSVFYAPIYRRTWLQERLVYVVPAEAK